MRKFDFDYHSCNLKRFFRSADLSARCPSAIKSVLRKDRRVADVIPVVLARSASVFALALVQTFQANGVERTVSISSMGEKGWRRNHLSASLLVKLKRSPIRVHCLPEQIDDTPYLGCGSLGRDQTC